MVGTDGIGLEKGRELLAGWGYRRCEDIVWLKSNRKNPEGDLTREVSALIFARTIPFSEGRANFLFNETADFSIQSDGRTLSDGN